ncbi:MAG TPA: DUF4097 family beta strand repeat-containing protein [Lachnospiraceae bacterium]|nr:DUF4097 family beta strand repeat-containing protein [Lachnospiraceae bacterium]
MQTYRKIRFAFITVVIIIGVLILSDQSTGERVSYSFTPTGEVHNLRIDIASTDVTIVQGNEFKVDGKDLYKDGYRIEMDGDTLVVETGKQDYFVLHLGLFEKEEKITITVPSSFQFDKIDVSVGSGDVTSRIELLSNQIDIIAGSGDVNLKEVVNSNSSISVGSGTVAISDIQSESTDVSVGSGDIDIDYIESGKAALSVGSGDIFFKSLTSNECSLDTGSGDIEGSGLEVTRMETEVGSGSIDLKGIINGESSFECGSGDIDLRLKGNKDDYSFHIDGDDVEINGDSYQDDFKSDTKLDKHLNLSVDSGSIHVVIK